MTQLPNFPKPGTVTVTVMAPLLSESQRRMRMEIRNPVNKETLQSFEYSTGQIISRSFHQ